MTNKDNGGPAFPVREDFNESQGRYVQYASDGMTLRDYFAAKAMQTLLRGSVLPQGYDASEAMSQLSLRSYEAADAMLKERAK